MTASDRPAGPGLTAHQRHVLSSLASHGPCRTSALVFTVWPDAQHRYSSNGGPPGSVMNLGKTLNALEARRLVGRASVDVDLATGRGWSGWRITQEGRAALAATEAPHG